METIIVFLHVKDKLLSFMLALNFNLLSCFRLQSGSTKRARARSYANFSIMVKFAWLIKIQLEVEREGKE
jgi:hypothetical protein